MIKTKNTYGMTVDEYRDYVAEYGPDVFKLLDGKVSFLGRGDKLFEASGYTFPFILISSPGAHYVDLKHDYGVTFQGGHVELYTPTTLDGSGDFIIYNVKGARGDIYCKKSDVLWVLNSVI